MKIKLTVNSDWGLIGITDENNNRLTEFEVDMHIGKGMYRKIYESSKIGILPNKIISEISDSGFTPCGRETNLDIREYCFDSDLIIGFSK